jgi:uncharacterized protein (TIGR00369 family)
LSTPGTEPAGLVVTTAELLKNHLLGELEMRDVPAKDGELAIEMALTPRLVNNRGGLQGGLIATLVDVVTGRVAATGLDRGISVATSDLSLHYLSAVTVGPARAEATAVRRGKRQIVLRAEVYDVGRDDKLAAICTATFAVLPLRAGQVDVRPQDDAGISE